MTCHSLPKHLLVIANRFGLTIKEVDDLHGVWRIWDPSGRQYAIKHFRRGVSSLILSSRVHIKAGERTPGLLPTLLQSSSNLPFVYYQGAHFIAMDWVTGRKLDYFRIDDRLRALKAIVQWRSAVRSIEVPKSLRLWRQRRTIMEKQIREMEVCRIIAQSTDDDFARIYLSDWDYYYRQACLARNLLENEAYKFVEEVAEERGDICHHDWAHHNLILSPNGKVTVLDLEYIIGDIGISDFIDLLYRFLQLDRGNPQVIPLYFHWLNNFYRLTSEEKRGFQIMFKWPEAYWILGRQYFIERIYRYQKFAVERYLRKIPRPEYWLSWQDAMADSLGLTRLE